MTDIDWACSQPIMSVYNASGTIYFNGFHPASASSLSPGNWSLNTAIHNVDNFTANTSMLYQTLWLDTSPTVELSSPQLPYRGCVFGFNGGLLATRAVSTYANENNSCNDVLAMTCQENILSLAKSYAIASVGTNNNCNALVDELLPQSSFMSGCQYNAFDGYQNEEPFGNPSFLATNRYNMFPYPTPTNSTFTCPYDVGSGNASSAIILRNWESDAYYANQSSQNILPPAGNYTDYYGALRSSWAVLMVVWAQNGSVDTSRLANPPYGFWDVRLLCVSPNTIQQGSLPYSSGASRCFGLRMTICLVAAIMLISYLF